DDNRLFFRTRSTRKTAEEGEKEKEEKEEREDGGWERRIVEELVKKSDKMELPYSIS
ncbi:hypothetical protein AVEN_32054-1, partial [Araneus ventricosus]